MRSNSSNDASSFLPTDYVRGKGQARASMFAIMLFVLVLAGVIGAFFVNHQRWSRVHEQQKVVAAAFKEETAKIEQLKELEEQRVVLTDKAEIVTALKDRVPRSVLMGEVIRGIGSGITLTEINLEGTRVRPPAPKAVAKGAVKSIGVSGVGNGKDQPAKAPKVHPPKFMFVMSVDGLSVGNDDIADYLASLQGSPLLSSVELMFIKQTKIDSVEYRKFRISMKLSAYADASLVEGTMAVGIDVDGFGDGFDDEIEDDVEEVAEVSAESQD